MPGEKHRAQRYIFFQSTITILYLPGHYIFYGSFNDLKFREVSWIHEILCQNFFFHHHLTIVVKFTLKPEGPVGKVMLARSRTYG